MSELNGNGKHATEVPAITAGQLRNVLGTQPTDANGPVLVRLADGSAVRVAAVRVERERVTLLTAPAPPAAAPVLSDPDH